MISELPKASQRAPCVTQFLLAGQRVELNGVEWGDKRAVDTYGWQGDWNS